MCMLIVVHNISTINDKYIVQIMLAQRVEDLEQKLKEQQEMIDKLFCLYYQKMD